MLDRACKLGFFAAVMCAGTLWMAASSVSLAADGAAPPTPPATEGDAPATPPATRPGARTGLGPQTLLGRLRPHLDELNLTPDQKTKVDAIFAKAGQDLEAAMAAGAADQNERRQKVMKVLLDLKEQVGAVLDPDQKEKLQKILVGIRPAPATAASAGGGGAGKLPLLGQSLEKLDLSPDQKAKVHVVMEDLKTKIADLRAQAKSGTGAEDIREKYKTIADEARQKLTDLLTPEQQAKLHDLMTQEPAAKSSTEAQPTK